MQVCVRECVYKLSVCKCVCVCERACVCKCVCACVCVQDFPALTCSAQVTQCFLLGGHDQVKCSS